MVPLFLALLDHLTEPLHDSRILMGEECRTAFVQRSYPSHLRLHIIRFYRLFDGAKLLLFCETAVTLFAGKVTLSKEKTLSRCFTLLYYPSS